MLSRVSQLDTSLLDNELFNILIKDPSAEVALILRAVLLHLGLKTYKASYGARLQNLIYSGLTARKRWLFVLLATVPVYVHQKIRDGMLINGWPDYPPPQPRLAIPIPFCASGSHGLEILPQFSKNKARRKREFRRFAWDILMRLEKTLAFSSLVNFLFFLYDGRHPTLLSRILKLQYTYAQKSVARNVSYDFLNRQLVWEAFTEFLLLVLPIVNIQGLRRRLGLLIAKGKAAISSKTAESDQDEGQDGKEGDNKPKKGPLHHLPPEVCAVCYLKSPKSADPMDPIDPTTSTAFLASMSNKDDTVMIPYLTKCCDARYCYYCIASAIVEEFSCLRCGQKVVAVQRDTAIQ